MEKAYKIAQMNILAKKIAHKHVFCDIFGIWSILGEEFQCYHHEGDSCEYLSEYRLVAQLSSRFWVRRLQRVVKF